MSARREEELAGWDARALAYGALVRRHPLFVRLAERLIDLVPDTALDVLDVGAGTGLVAERLLLQRPDARLHLCEPAPGMRALAEARLGTRVASLRPLAAEEVDQDPTPVDAALASACLHLSELPAGLRAVGARLRPGGALAFNLWWHAWAPTADVPDTHPLWYEPLARALEAAGHDPALLPAPPARREPIEPSALETAAADAGLDLEVLAPDYDLVPAAFFVDFAAMDPALLAEVPERDALLADARDLARGEARVASTRFELCRGD